MKTFVFTTLLALTLVTFTSGQFSNPPPASHSLGADPYQDTTPVYIASKLQVYAARLLSQEQRFLGEQSEANIDFNLWYNDVLNRFVLQQDQYSYRTQADKTRDLNSFKRQLSALRAEFTESMNHRQFAFDTRMISNYWNKFTHKFVELSKEIIEAGNQYNELKRQQLALYAELIEISGAIYVSQTKTYHLFNIGGPNSSPLPNIQVESPSEWKMDAPAVGPLGSISTSYPDPGSKLGILYSKIQTLYTDFINSGSSGQRQALRRALSQYQVQWVELAQKWLAYRKDVDRLGQKMSSIASRTTDILGLLNNILTVGALPATVWMSLDSVVAGTPYNDVF